MTPLCSLVPSDYREVSHPKLAFALRLAEAWEAGNHRLFLRLAKDPPAPLTPWAFLMRCLMAPAVVDVRLCLLKCMNKALMKGAKMKIDELGRLLFCSAEEAGAIVREVGMNLDGDCVVFKTVSIEEAELLVKRDDNFVLGETLKERIVRQTDEDGVALFSAEFARYILK